MLLLLCSVTAPNPSTWAPQTFLISQVLRVRMREPLSQAPCLLPPRRVSWATAKQKSPRCRKVTYRLTPAWVCARPHRPLHQAASDTAASYPRVSKLMEREPKTEATFLKNLTREITSHLFAAFCSMRTSSHLRPGDYPGVNCTRLASLGTVPGATPHTSQGI